MARKGIIIGVVVAVAVLAGLSAIGLNASTNNGSTTTSDEAQNQTQPAVQQEQPQQQQPDQDKEARMAELLETYPWMHGYNTASNIAFSGTPESKEGELAKVHGPHALFIEILTGSEWSGAAQGSDFVQQSDDGYGYAVNTVTCEPGGIYSAAYQLGSDTGEMWVVAYQDGEVLKHGYTDADYGIVSVSGTC